MPKIVCVSCQIELTCDKTGLPAVEMADFGPYKIWEVDRWACPSCGMKVIAGFADRPSFVHYIPGFKEAQEKQKARKGYIEFGHRLS